MPGDNVDSNFLYYRLVSARGLLESRAGGSTFQEISGSALASVIVEVPDLDEQRSIAEVLGAIDDKIAANDQASQLSIRLIAALYARAIELSFEDVRILDALDIDFGEPFSGALFTDPDVGRPLMRIRDLKSCDPQLWTTEVRHRETVVAPGDVVVGMDAEFRATWWLGEPALLNQRVFRARSAEFGAALVATALRAPLRDLESQKSATTVIHLNKSDLARSTIRVPSERRAEFEVVAEAVLGAHVARARESRILAATRDELLPLLMSGKLRVRDAEKTVKGVL